MTLSKKMQNINLKVPSLHKRVFMGFSWITEFFLVYSSLI